jgi:hypothetical protein
MKARNFFGRLRKTYLRGQDWVVSNRLVLIQLKRNLGNESGALKTLETNSRKDVFFITCQSDV